MRYSLALALTAVVVSGCARRVAVDSQLDAPPREIIVEPARAPEGAQKLCWEEPKVAVEKNGPGLDRNGEWYHPAYEAVREAKMGRWVPCN